MTPGIDADADGELRPAARLELDIDLRQPALHLQAGRHPRGAPCSASSTWAARPEPP